MREIILSETKPAREWINGRILQKVSPRRKHALAQTIFSAALHAWAMDCGSGRVGTEWEFRVQPPGAERRSLVPDVAYLSYDRVPYEADAAADIPLVAPNVVIEVISPGDLKRDIEEKVRVYLAAGSDVVFLVDTDARTVTARAPGGVRRYVETDELRHTALPGFAMPVAVLFEESKPRRRAE